MTEYIYGTDGHEGHWLTDEKIIRCMDCASCYQDECFWRCGKAGFSIGFVIDDKPPRGFCAWGERRPRWRELENSDQYAAAAHAFDTTNHNTCFERGE